ncbi:glucose-6-phosphate dehydrogenase [Sphingomonas nostoxanthinifaciens]|uniref:glucose-6-phosphate dehydrogenase n=1 Tax=Sphingomonas nostoxanthinifaciens TaxID=2872652 RepID=UPI001CC1E0FB|nr:glucose-6-phosphate dehydrogenase [Sphingomonas nostoxanthinifaciens]UAK23510.1 glucose-6-phosphate dehydrogenase [Sphingomonas nostoxanthinifaciens]
MSAQPPQAPAATLVILGGTGDLTRRLLMPALVNLCGDGLIGDDLKIIGVGSREGDDEMLRGLLDEFVAKGPCWDKLRGCISYLPGDFTTDELFEALKGKVGDGNAAFYLATPGQFFGPIVQKLAKAGLMEESDGRFRRVLVEKPYGHDLASAHELNEQILTCVAESQVYRIDHFLGKETVQNIMVMRFANAFLEAAWNNRYIDHVQITAAETVDVGSRGSFYDATGAMRDMVPNHLFQLLAMVGMEAPNDFTADAIRTEKAKVLKAIRTPTAEEAKTEAVRGQYGAGRIGDRDVTAYTATADVASDSKTETYVALKLWVDSWRWVGVPFYLRTGKALAARDTEIVITFKRVPLALFQETQVDTLPPNRLILQIQPDEGIHLCFEVKKPGAKIDTASVSMDFAYADCFKIGGRTGYETLLYDMFMGDQTLFQRADQIEAGWAAVQPFLDAWAKGEGVMEDYAPGSAGPAAADALIARDGIQWHALGA